MKLRAAVRVSYEMVAPPDASSVPKTWRIPLFIAGLHDCGLAAYHFILPVHMQWRSGLDGVPDSLVWALFALNFSWSLLVLLCGALVIYAAWLGPSGGKFARVAVFTVGLFWALHGVYTWVNPLPLPPSLGWLRIALAAFPIVVVLLHWFPLFATRSPSTRSRQPRA